MQRMLFALFEPETMAPHEAAGPLSARCDSVRKLVNSHVVGFEDVLHVHAEFAISSEGDFALNRIKESYGQQVLKERAKSNWAAARGRWDGGGVRICNFGCAAVSRTSRLLCLNTVSFEGGNIDVTQFCNCFGGQVVVNSDAGSLTAKCLPHLLVVAVHF